LATLPRDARSQPSIPTPTTLPPSNIQLPPPPATTQP